VEWSGCGGESLKRSPFLLRRSSLASSSGLGGESHASSLAGKKAIKALGAGGGGVELLGEHHHLQEEIFKSSGRWSSESIIACWKLKSIKALGGSLESIITCRKKSKTPTKPTRRTMTTTTTAAALTNPSKTNLIL
jgi:hypothetical protein